MNDQVRRADTAALNAENRARQARQNYQALKDGVVREQARLRADFQRSVETLSSDIRDVELRQTERLDELRYDVQRSLEEQRAEFQGKLQEQRHETQAALDAINDRIASDKAAQRQYAETQLRDVRTLVSELRKDSSYERFAPGELDRLEARLAIASSHLGGEQFQASLAGTQEAYFRYQDVRQDVAERLAEWTAYLEALEQAASDLVGEIEAGQKAAYTFSEEGGEASTETPADIDFWSHGRFGEVSQRIEDIADRIATPKNLSTRDLRALLDQTGDLRNELREAVEYARSALVQSQIRQNLASSVLQTFEGTPWKLQESTYQHEDFRQAVHLRLENGANEQIVVSVRPVEGENELSAKVEINFFDRSSDERLRRERLDAISKGLGDADFAAAQFVCLDNSEGRAGDEQMLDFSRLRAPVAPASVGT